MGCATHSQQDEKVAICLPGKMIFLGVRRCAWKKAVAQIRMMRNFPDGADKSVRARSSPRVRLTTQWKPRKLFRAMTGYVITALLIKPLRVHARRIRMRSAPRTRGGCCKTSGKSYQPGMSRMQGYDRESPVATALNRALACTLNIDRPIRGKREFLSRLEFIVFIIADAPRGRWMMPLIPVMADCNYIAMHHNRSPWYTIWFNGMIAERI